MLRKFVGELKKDLLGLWRMFKLAILPIIVLVWLSNKYWPDYQNEIGWVFAVVFVTGVMIYDFIKTPHAKD